MLEFESKRKFKKRLYSKFTFLALLVILFFVMHGAWGIFQKQRMVSNELEKTEETLDQFNERKNELEEKLERINSNVGKEELLRDKYSVAKEGEKAVFILDLNKEEKIIVEEEGFFKKLFSDLFN